jgi:exodeoxyribonuclease VII large subunit
MKDKLFSVSDYLEIINRGLRVFESKILGEVSQVSFGPTGHVYFTLKDEKKESLIKCVIWKYKYEICGLKIEEGIKIIASGYPEIYAPWGRFSFKAETIEHAGEGTLKKEYDRLKKKLEEEGLFADSIKRPIPEYPQKIGVITSKQGAVIADFLNNLGKFGFKIKMMDSRVEGQAAALDLVEAVKAFRKEEIEVLVIMRGGGSLESMLGFNNEALVREIRSFPVPVIAAIGHHKDAPLAALAADFSTSTPSIAATVLSESWEQASSALLKEAVVFEMFKNVLQNSQNYLKECLKNSLSGFTSLVSTTKEQLNYSEKIIHLRNPETQLKLGYSLARTTNGKLIKKIENAKVGETMEVQVSDGKIFSKINKKS